MDEPAAGCPLHFAGVDFVARPSGALWRPGRRTLIVSDLHLGRSERFARRNGPLLPPWDSQETLDRLAAEIAALDPACVISLGDGFDDDLAGSALDDASRHRLWQLAGARDWIWIAGNHDPAPAAAGLPGRSLQEIRDIVAFRHEPGEGPDVAGHLHPVVSLAGRRWRCFALGRRHLILPAFGSYTGGLDLGDPAFRPLVSGGIAFACSEKMFRLPIP